MGFHGLVLHCTNGRTSRRRGWSAFIIVNIIISYRRKHHQGSRFYFWEHTLVSFS